MPESYGTAQRSRSFLPQERTPGIWVYYVGFVASKTTSMWSRAASRFSDRALEFLRRGEKNRSSAFHSTQIDFTSELAL
jgi:hypothetical protein